MSEDERVTDLDLMAYADGVFVADCDHRRRVERHLAECREDAERVAAYQAQNAAIRSAFADLVAEPVPDQIDRIFTQHGEHSWAGPLKRAAAAAFIAVVAAAAGWYAAIKMDGSATSSSERVAGSPARDVAEPPVVISAAGSNTTIPSYHAADARIVIEIAPPNLSAQNLTLTRIDRVRDEAGAAVRLSYIGPRGEPVSLLLRLTQDRKPSRIRVHREDGTAVASWQSGSLAVALTADREGTHLTKLAAAVQAAIGDSLTPGSLSSRMAGEPLPGRQIERPGEILPRQYPDSSQVPKVN